MLLARQLTRDRLLRRLLANFTISVRVEITEARSMMIPTSPPSQFMEEELVISAHQTKQNMLASSQIKQDQNLSKKSSLIPKFYTPVSRVDEGQLGKDIVPD